MDPPILGHVPERLLEKGSSLPLCFRKSSGFGVTMISVTMSGSPRTDLHTCRVLFYRELTRFSVIHGKPHPYPQRTAESFSLFWI